LFSFGLLIRLGVTTVAAFAVLFAPWIPPFAPLSALLSGPIHRIFPFARGLFEDKVANFWCASNVVFKWRDRLSAPALLRASAGFTALGFLPGVVGMLWAGWTLRPAPTPPTPKDKTDDSATATPGDAGPPPHLQLLPYTLLTSAMSFLLFSFQVHEKTILLPLLPLTLLGAGASPGSALAQWSVLANNVGMVSMWPLLRRDGLAVQYGALLMLWNRLLGTRVTLHPESLVEFMSLVCIRPS
jgi:alpha-1,3-glucosyltransferase